MTPLHILVVNVHFRPYSYGGATLVAEAVAVELARRGHRISVISAMPGPRRAAYQISRTSPFPGVENYLVTLPPNRGAKLADENSGVLAAIAPLIARLAPDLAHVHCVQEIGAGVVSLLKSQAIPTILSFHDFWWVCARQFLFRSDHRACVEPRVDPAACLACAGPTAPDRLAALGTIASAADLRTAPGRFAARFCEESGTGPVTLWENGIHPPGASFAASREGRSGPVTFGYLGGPSAPKGWPQLRDAARLIGRDDFQGLVVDAGVFAPWWKPAMLAGLRGDWRIHPRFAPAEADGFYRRIDALIFPSQWRESFGLAVREALARGLRVIRTDAGGQAEHASSAGVRTLPLGAPPQALAEAMTAVIDEINAGAPRTLAALPMRSVSEQTDTFLELCRELGFGGNETARLSA